MSKAFTRESDDAPEPLLRLRPSSPLPPGAKNYITAEGLRELQAELNHLKEIERPKFIIGPEDPDARRQLQIIDQQIEQLDESLATAVVVPSPAQPWDQVLFGATVTVRGRGSGETSYRLVGVDETDLDQNWVSWLSPIARALLNARLGQRVRFKFPSGEEELEIVRIDYE
ncbi:MAG: GreA/GreB family elongation factor [Akkermansiaceae bacterium]|nr:GreA/GreB family elongation factor [Verrucomicrobiales bacterium]